ncbi:hypothetical protein EXN66_Car015256 [Channa argus]|uniref:Uncharacterized protein n=1 Tax=Channa argus TaxID=215402 RepID=A0A6G1QAY1_CHAAH|nr:hypothetical protein EXN66_Car015256 [Channa argus]
MATCSHSSQLFSEKKNLHYLLNSKTADRLDQLGSIGAPELDTVFPYRDDI